MNCGQAKSAAGLQEKLQARDSVSSDTVDMPVVPEWPAESAIQPPIPPAPGYAMMPPLPKKSHMTQILAVAAVLLLLAAIGAFTYVQGTEDRYVGKCVTGEKVVSDVQSLLKETKDLNGDPDADATRDYLVRLGKANPSIPRKFGLGLLFPLVGAEGTTALRLVLGAIILSLVMQPWRAKLDLCKCHALLAYGLALGYQYLGLGFWSVLPLAAKLTASRIGGQAATPLLFRADSGFDSAKLMCAIGQQAKALAREVAFIIKWNPRTTPVESIAAARVADASTACAADGACDASQVFFWDGIHPTSAGHQVMARLAVAAIPEPATGLLLGLAFLGLAATRRRAA